MRLLPTIALLLLPALAEAQAPRPQKLGDHGSWTAATVTEGGQKVCYAFARATKTEGGGTRQNVLLTVTHRPQARDTVTVSAGYAYQRGTEANMTVSGGDLPFYTSGQTAAARDGAAVVRAFRNGRDAVLRAAGPNGRGQVTDTFPLAGFGAAYDAISRECPRR